MVRNVKRVVVWAHSECRSTAALYDGARRLAEARGIEVRYCLWGKVEMPEGRRMPLVDAVRVGDDLSKGRDILRRWGGAGTVQVFCTYQNSSVWRRLMVEAKRGGARVVVYSEPPCEMCLGFRAVLKRLYFRWILPRRVRRAVAAADLFISQGGEFGVKRLIRLGWDERKIVPFGYASPRLESSALKEPPATGSVPAGKLKVLHLGSEAPYRGLRVLERAMSELGAQGYELVRTVGKRDAAELPALIRAADVVVACGLCEPWGMRVNDVLSEGVPVVVSDGMGASVVCKWHRCGLVVRKGDAADLARALRRCREEPGLLSRLRERAADAAIALAPESRANAWLSAVLGEGLFACSRRKVVHVCDGWARWNGAANIARMIVGEQASAGDVVVRRRWAGIGTLRSADEVWIHCGWKPCLWWAAFWAKRAVWVPEACYDPVRLRYHGWKKALVGPFERWALRRCDRIVATCEGERGWVREYLGGEPPVEVTDIKRFFKLDSALSDDGKDIEAAELSHLLYLGRRHPLKGVAFLERAVAEINRTVGQSNGRTLDFRVVSNAFGAEKEKVWSWCDVLCLPTLSDNFGLVVAEALERGKAVIVTDGAPAWEAVSPDGFGGRLTYVRGYRDGDDETRVRLLKEAICRVTGVKT